VKYLADKGGTHLAIDSPSMGASSGEWEGKPLAQMTHVAFLETGGSWTEFVRNVASSPRAAPTTSRPARRSST
jgi:hypothetical protein